MSYTPHPAPSFDADSRCVATGPNGERAHQDAIAHGEHLAYRLWQPRPGVWSLVGNGLSNQSFVLGPEGLIVIDTGECVEEMAAALTEVRKHTDAPIAAVIYSHFHYVGGTRALVDAGAPANLPIWGHVRIAGNRLRIANEVGTAYSRGMVQQFGIRLPDKGPDAMLHCGIGRFFRNPGHAPFTGGHIPVNHSFDTPTRARIAGLDVWMTPAPSDADDSITIWFPELGVCINNLVWPALFNIFPIRGEEYRDPRVLLTGLDHILGLAPEHLVGAHGPPLSGAAAVRDSVTDYRDAIQFLWDQTVRGINRGLSLGEMCETVRLPAHFARSYFTRELYGVAEHHVRQIHSGLRGWFDGDEAQLFPLPPVERAMRLIEGFGGAQAVREQADAALQADDLRWALELATWLTQASGPAELPRVEAGAAKDRARLGTILRTLAQRTPSANIRNWCLTRALDLEGQLDLSRFRRPRFFAADVLEHPPAAFVHALRVLVLPDRAQGLDEHLVWHFADGEKAGLRLRHHVAVPTDGEGATLELRMDRAVWARILGGKLSLDKAMQDGDVRFDGERLRLACALAVFDLPALWLN